MALKSNTVTDGRLRSMRPPPAQNKGCSPCCANKEENILDMFTKVDKNGLTFFHRAASMYSIKIFEEAKEIFAENDDKYYSSEASKQLYHKKWMSGSQENFGVSPLTIALVEKQPGTEIIRQKFIEYLINDFNADVNNLNSQTLWTPFHWAARHGDFEIVKLMIEKGVKAFTPDSKGFFPIHLAGYFQHKDVVQLLLKHSIDCYKALLLENKKKPSGMLLGVPDIDPDIFKNNNCFLASSMYATVLLFWAVRFQGIDKEDIKFILEQMESYPEAAIPIGFLQTSIHSAALNGDVEVINLLCEDFKQRHQFKTQDDFESAKKRKFLLRRKINNLQTLSQEYEAVLKFPKLKKLRKQQQKVWDSLLEVHKMPISFAIQDKELNTPLHLAAMKNNIECEKVLAEKWRISIDIRNSQGVMSKNMGTWFKETDQYFKDYYVKVDQMLYGETQSDQEKGKNNGDWLETQTSTIRRIVSQEIPDGLINKGLMQCRAEIPQLPSLVLRCQAKTDAQQKHIDFIIRALDANKFCINMFQSLDPNQYYITLNLDQAELEKEAILSSYEVKLSQYNVRVPFNVNLKQYMSPFVSKDIQVLTLQRLTRLFNINDLMNEKIVKSVFSMQDENDLFFVDNSFSRKGWRKFVPHFILKSSHYIYEQFDGKQTFKDLAALSNYFGEKDALARGFFQFYSVWIIPIMLFAVGITIHQFVVSSSQTYTNIQTQTPGDQPESVAAEPPRSPAPKEKSMLIVNQELDILFIFAIFVQIFSTVMIEFWKRKEKHIEFVLGRSIDEEQDQTKLNPNYLGFKKMSWTKFDTTKEEDPVKKRKTRFYTAILVLSSLFLLGVSIAGYVGLNQRVENGLLRGFLLTIVTTVTSQLQLIASRSLIELSNIKYEKDRSQAFMISMMSFRLVNVNLPLVYAICTQPQLDPNDFSTSVAAQYSTLYFLILGAIGTQCAGVFYGRYLPKYAQFKLSKWFYFCKIRRLALNQIRNHRINSSQVSNADQNEISNKASKEIFKDFLPDSQPADHVNQNQIQPQKKLTSNQITNETNNLQRKKKGCCTRDIHNETYQRFVLKSEFTAQNEKNFQILIDAVEINNLMMEKTEQSQISDLVEKYVIYSLGLLYCGVCPAATIIVFLFFTIDPVIERYMDCNVCKRTQPSVDRTLYIWTLYAEAIIIAVVVSNTLLLYQATNTYEHMLQGWFGVPDRQIIWYILLIEHLVIGFLLTIKFVIPDTPRELTKIIHSIKLELDRFHGLNAHKIAKQDDGMKIQDAATSKKKDNTKELIQYYNKSKSEIEIREGRLADFLQVDPRENNYQKIVNALDDALKVNLEIRMYRETFLLVERSILQRKMQNFIKLNKSVLISCVECSKESATQFCMDCGDHFCVTCCQILHKKSPIFKKHQIATFNTNPQNYLPPISTSSKSQGSTIWRKFEYFNFPLNPHNQELFRQIQGHFEYLKRAYIKLNYINDQTGKMDIASVLIDQNYDSLEREMGSEILNAHIKEFGRKTVLSQKEAIDTKNFNDEELFLLNRLAFRLFKKSGSQVRFDLFMKDLTTFQNGPFDQRLNLWLRSINELEEHVREYNKSDINLEDDHLISRTKFNYMVNASYPQDLSGQVKASGIIDQIFGSDAFLQISEIQSLIIKNKEASELMYCVLQIDSQEAAGISTSHSVTSFGLIEP